ncbi:PaaI family thioesterase [Comamonas composti]|uniref:PaaI family thioesterase n=1 Tax=Comamonas composti TaxID=408558 RepID=UPI0003F78373|nr:PaaI family thioesterase [Comamonas composti]
MQSFGPTIPFVEHLGFTLHKMEGGESELRYEAAPEHMNTFAMTHGGALMTLLDVAMAVAGRSLESENFGCVTIEMKTSFMQPSRGPLVAKGLVLHRTRTMAYTEGRVFDASGRLCCHATGTFKYMPRAPKPGAGGETAIVTD